MDPHYTGISGQTHPLVLPSTHGTHCTGNPLDPGPPSVTSDGATEAHTVGTSRQYASYWKVFLLSMVNLVVFYVSAWSTCDRIQGKKKCAQSDPRFPVRTAGWVFEEQKQCKLNGCTGTTKILPKLKGRDIQTIE